jgi:hypothetical protein
MLTTHVASLLLMECEPLLLACPVKNGIETFIQKAPFQSLRWDLSDSLREVFRRCTRFGPKVYGIARKEQVVSLKND